MEHNGIHRFSRRIDRAVESGVGGWGAVMEVVARRKFAAKDKFEPLNGAEVPTGPQITLWRPWTFCLLLGCIFTITASLWGHPSSYASVATTEVAVNLEQFSKLPAITTEEMGIPIPYPTPSIYVQDVVLFPDNVMLLVRVSKSVDLEGSMDSLECRFGGNSHDSANTTMSPVISIKRRTKDLQMVRCSLPADAGFPSKRHSNVTLGIRDSEIRVESNAFYHPRAPPSWESLVYESLIDANSLILLAKGLVSKSSMKVNVMSLKCVFGTDLPSEILYETEVLAAAQEVIRCQKPPYYLEEKLRGHRVSVKATWLGVLPSVTYYDPDNHSKNFLASFLGPDFSTTADESSVPLEGDSQIGEEDGQVGSSWEPSLSDSPLQVSTLDDEKYLLGDPASKRKLCACTMVWNKAQFIREWVVFHSFMGVEKFFVYDNDSDDNTDEILDSLSDYNVSRMVWPWIKTQQAAFSHCTILARDECDWMLFTDVDEYIYPYAYLRKGETEPSDALVLQRLIDTESRNADDRDQNLGQIQFDCHNFGPSGLTSTPKQGVTVGYTCRARAPERHKSIIMLEALDESLLNVLHHFELQEIFHTIKLSRRVAVCNHYKFQAWDAFKMKFVRRAGTYTTDWKKDESRGSKDRTPGLGTEAVKPANWEGRFCDVHDTGLQEFVLRTFALPGEPNKLVWQLDDQSAPTNDDQPTHDAVEVTHDEEEHEE